MGVFYAFIILFIILMILMVIKKWKEKPVRVPTDEDIKFHSFLEFKKGKNSEYLKGFEVGMNKMRKLIKDQLDELL